MRIARKSRIWVTVAVVCVLTVWLAGCSGDPNKKKQKYLESGERYFDKGEYREAEIQYENAIQVDSRFAEAHHKLALAAMKLQDFRDADQELETTIQLQPDNYAALLDSANLLVMAYKFGQARDRIGEAKQHLDLLVKKQPNNPEVYTARANYYAATNNDTAALADMQKALELSPNRSDSYLNVATLQTHAQLWDAAEANYKRAVNLSPKSANAILELGKFYQSRGRFPEAEQMFQKAITAAPSDPTPRLAMASLYMAENKYGQAEDFLRQAKNDFPNNSVGYRMLGDFYFANNQIDKATDEYGVLYQDHPKDMLVKKNYIQLLIMKDRVDEARKLNDEVLKAQPDDEDAQIYKGEIELHSGNAGDAVNTLQAVLKNNPDSPIAHFQLGLAFNQLGNTNRSEAEWRDAVRLRPEMVDAHRALAGVAIQRNDASMLAEEADQIMTYQPGAPDGYLLRALAELDRKDYATAEDYIHRSLERDPDNPAAYVQLGNLRIAQNKFAEAQQAYQQALDKDPNSTDAMGGVLNVYLLQKQPDRAIAAIKAQLSKFPKSAGFHIMLGQLLMDEKKDLAGAEQEFQQAVDLDKNNSEAMIKLGVVRSERGDTDQALQTYLAGSKINPKEIAFYLLAGGIYENQKDWEHARQEYQKVLDIQPENPLASNNLAYVMLQQGGNVDVAFAMAQTARRQLPDNPNSADTLGWAFYHKQVYGSAITLFKEAVKKEPENALYNYHLGLAYAKSGQAGLARQQLDRLVKLKPDSPNVDELRRALAEAKG